MPNTILSSPYSQPLFIAINEVAKIQCWKNLKILDVEIGSSAANTEQPLSTEQWSEATTFTSLLVQDIQTIKIIQPSSLKITAIAPDIDTLEGIIQTFADVTMTLSISTKSIITVSLVITDIEVEQSFEMLTASKVTISLEQAQPPEFTSYIPRQTADASLYGISIQEPKTINLNVLDVFKNTLADYRLPGLKPPPGALIDAAGGPFILDVSKLA